MTAQATSSKKTLPSDEQEYYLLQPMFEKLPPNQIISSKYAPDTLPQVKLMSKDERKNNFNYVPPKTKSIELSNYADIFNIFDYLGKHYAPKMNEIVYFKFDNCKFNLIPHQKYKTRVMPALYLPFRLLSSLTTAASQVGFTPPSTLQPTFSNTSKENWGCSFNPIFSSNYQSSNLFAAIRKSPFSYELVLQNDVNSCESVGWFNFAVQFREEGYYTFKIVNLTEDMSNIFASGMRVSYCCLNAVGEGKKSGEGWGLCGENIKFNRSEVEREERRGEFYFELSFQFKCKNKHDAFMFALHTPYAQLDAQTYFSKLLVKKIKNMFKVERREFGITITGSPLISYQISRKKMRGQSIREPHSENLLSGKDKRKSINLLPISKCLLEPHRSIVVIGRIAGADTSGSYITEGMIDYLLDSMEFESMKRAFNFHFIPLLNIDAVKYGSTTTNLTGSLLNRSWRSPSRLYQPQVYYLKEYLQEINRENPISLIINLTSEFQEVQSSVIGIKNHSTQSQDSRIFPFILSKRNKLSFEKSVFLQKNQNNSMCCVLKQLFQRTLIYELKVSHFQASEKKGQDNDKFHGQLRQCSSESYRTFGKNLLSNYLQHVKLYDKNLLLKDKWVKEIDQVTAKITKKLYAYADDKKVEEKFPLEFYSMPNTEQIVYTFKGAKPFITNRVVNYPKIVNLERLSKTFKRQNIQDITSVNNFLEKRKQTEEYLNPKLVDDNSRKVESQDTIIEKPQSLFRITEKKTSLLLNSQKHFKFDIQDNRKKADKMGQKIVKENNKGQRKARISKGEQAMIEKQVLRKELSAKLLKKMRIEETVNAWKAKDKQVFGQSFNNA